MLATPEVFYQAGRRRREETERSLDRRDQQVLTHLGVPLLAAIPFTILAVAAVPMSRLGLLVLGGLAASAWLSVLLVFAFRLRILLERRADRNLYKKDSFAYGMEAAGGPGVLEPIELLGLINTGQRELAHWLEVNAPTAEAQEAFRALAPQWVGTAEELARASQNL